MKILYINSLYSPLVKGGAELSLKLIVEGMKQAGHEVVVLSLHKERGLRVDWVDGVKVYRAGLLNYYWPYTERKPGKLLRLAWHLRDRSNPAMGKIVRDVLDKELPDVVSCHNLSGWSISVWKEVHQKKIPILQVLHDLYLLCANSNMFKAGSPCPSQCLSCRLLRGTHLHQSQCVSAVVGISQHMIDRFSSYGYFSKASKHVVHNSRAIPESPIPSPRMPGQPIIFGYLGTLSPIKGVEWLIDEFSRLTIPASLKIAGSGEESFVRSLREKAENQAIEFMGYVNAMEFLGQIDVLVVPSLWDEPLGMVAIEALAAHVPVITTGKGGLGESVKNGINGLYCQYEIAGSLSDAMLLLYDHPELYNQLQIAARPSVDHFLDPERIIREYEDILLSLIKESSPIK